MSATITGEGLGIFNLTGAVQGEPGLGRHGERVYVNSTSGNLIIQQQDEFLTGLGLDLGLVRTYNSQGQFNDDNGDNWRLNVAYLANILPGSSLLRVHGDGHESSFVYNAGNGRYQSSDGEGAHDWIVDNGDGTWTYTEGSSLISETYNSIGQLVSRADSDANTITYQYNIGGLISQINDASGQTVVIQYNDNQITSIQTTSNSQTTTRVYYGYDSLNRLSQVIVDLTPDGDISAGVNGIGTYSSINGELYVTTYGYDSQDRVTSITSGSGESIGFSYDVSGRIQSVTDGTAGVTTYNYISSTQTDVTNALSQTSSLLFDTQGRLIEVQEPAINGTRASMQYVYDADNNLTRVVDANGNAAVYSYDNGNLVYQRDAEGNVIRRSYDANNQLILETQYGNADTDGDGPALESAPVTSRFIYDTNARLIYSIDALGRVTQNIYDSFGQLTSVIQYTANTYDISALTENTLITRTQLDGWVVLQPLAQIQRSDFSYDFRGQLATQTDYAAIDSSGNGIRDGSESLTRFVYDQYGRLLQTIDPRGEATADANDYTTHFVFDGLGRLLSSTDAQGITTTTFYDDANNRVTTSAANGLGNTAIYDSNGHIIQSYAYDQAEPSTHEQIIDYFYDAEQRLLMTETQNGARSFNVYDAEGRLAAVIAPDGALTESVYDAGGNVIKTIAYATRLDTSTLVDMEGKPVALDLTTLRPAPGNDRITHKYYDRADRLIYSVDALGYVTQYFYDGREQLIDTIAYTNPVDINNLPLTLGTQLTQTTIWREDFDSDLSQFIGDTNQPDLLRVENGGLVIDNHNNPGATALVPDISTNALFDSVPGRVVRFEFTTDNNAASRFLLFGLVTSGEPEVRGLRLNNYWDNIARVRENVGATQTTYTIGSLKDLTTYRVEIVFSGIDATLYLYEQGQRREQGMSHTLAGTDWGQVRPIIYGYASSSISGTALTTINYLEVLDESQTTASLNIQPHADDRHSRMFYNAAGQLQASLDAEGYLAENKYDAAGRLVETIAYAKQTSGALRSGGTLQQLHPGADPANDIHTYTLYNSRAQVTGMIDGEGYLSETIYDTAGNITQTIRYANPAQTWFSGATIADVRPTGSSGRSAVNTYNELNQLTSSINHEGSITRYLYDNIGNLLQTSVADASVEQRDLHKRYDVYGRVTAELSTRGAELLSMAQNQSEMDSIWNEHALFYSYDSVGQLTQSRDQNGNITRFYYDEHGRLVYTINALGEVSEQRYNTFGQQQNNIAYANSLTPVQLATLPGGTVNTYVIGVIGSLASADDIQTTLDYDVRGAVLEALDAEGYRTTNAYNAFGELASSTQQINGANSVTRVFGYDARGLNTFTMEDTGGGTPINRTTASQYDAFGRVIAQFDANNNQTRFSYDRLGRVVTTTDALNNVVTNSYDAFSQVLTVRDANGAITTYTYDDNERSVTITTAEGIQTKTIRNRHGETVEIYDGKGVLAQATDYDSDGRLIAVRDADNNSVSNSYDDAGLLLESTDARNTITRYEYDAANRVIKTTVDPGGLNIVTSVVYDSFGRTIRSTDANGVITETQYDKRGQVTAVIVDPVSAENPNGLNLTTQFTYDGLTNQLTVINAAGTAEQRTVAYQYDNLGRRISETLDPAGLNITTTYIYDANANVVAVIDPNGNITRHVYDELNRQQYQVLADGAVAQTIYDSVGNVVETVNHANAISLNGLGLSISTADISSRLVPDTMYDQKNYAVYDQNQRLRFSIDTLGQVSEQNYDANNNVVQNITHALPIDINAFELSADKLSEVTAQLNAQTDKSASRHRWAVYDKLNRVRYSVDALGAVTENRYDANGNILHSILYSGLLDSSAFALATDKNAYIDGQLASISDNNADRHTRIAYDALNRAVFNIDAIGVVSEQVYDANGNVIKTLAYANTVSVSALDAATDRLAYLRSSVDSQLDADNDRVSWVAYDSLNRAVFSVNASGAVTEQVYDANGNIIKTLAYAHTISVAALNAAADRLAYLRSSVDGQLDADNDRVVWSVYNSLNRVIFRVDASGAVSEQIYDANGNIIKSLAYANTINTAQMELAADREAYLRSTLGTQLDGGRDQVSWNSYDAFNQLIYQVNSHGAVSQRRYDTFGNTLQTIAYANTIDTSGIDTAADRMQYISSEVNANQDAARDQFSHIVYDQLDRAVYTISALGQVSASSYNRFGEAVSATRYAAQMTFTQYDLDSVQQVVAANSNSGLDQTTISQFNNRGELVSQQDPLGHQEIYTYNRFGERIELIDKNGQAWQSQYDQRGLLVKEISPDVDVVSIVNAPVVSTINSVQKIVNTNSYDVFGNLISHTNAENTSDAQSEYYVYDSLNRQTYSVDAAGGVRQSRYDVFGNIIENIAYATAIDTGGFGANITEQQILDLLHPAANAARQLQVYNQLNQQVYVLNAIGGIAENRYDSFGRATAQIAYAEFLDLSKLDDSQDLRAQIKTELTLLADAARDNRVSSVYDQFGQLRYSVDAHGAVLESSYDHFGNSIEQIQYANTISPVLADSVNALQMIADALIADNSRDKHTYAVYDQRNRLRYQINALGYVSENHYDALDQIVLQHVYATPIGLNTAKTVAAIAAAVQNSTDDRSTRNIYDQHGKLRFSIDSLGYINESRYDANGRMVGSIAYAEATSLTDIPSFDDVQQTVTTLDLNAARHTHYHFDALGRQIEIIDALNKNELTSYDALGNKVSFTNKKSDTWLYRYDAASRLIEEITPEIEITRINESTGQHSEVITQEYIISKNEYDALGNVIARTEAAGTPEQRTTRYVFDALGRQTGIIYTSDNLVQYTSGNQMVYLDSTIERAQYIPVSGTGLTLQPDITGMSIRLSSPDYSDTTPTHIRTTIYDQNGSIVEAVDTVVALATGGAPDIETVSNWAGHVNISATTLANGVYTARIELIDNAGVAADGQDGIEQNTIMATIVVGSGTSLSNTPSLYSETFYDALGNAVVNRDANGVYSYKVYDQLGRVAYEVDAEHYVTAYSYDAFSNQLSTTRHATPVAIAFNRSAPLSLTEMNTLIQPSSQDRTLNKQYDQLDRHVATQENTVSNYDPQSAYTAEQAAFSAAKQSQTVYNAFGEIVLSRQLHSTLGDADSGNDVWLESYTYYDQLGRRALQVDAKGYVTQWQYDERGNILREMQYARAATGSWDINTAPTPVITSAQQEQQFGYDRELTFTYDKLNRVLSETRVGVRYEETLNNNSVETQLRYGDLTTTHYYDAVGNNVMSIDSAGNVVNKYYDALGRTVAVAEPDIQLDEGNLPALSVVTLDETNVELHWDKRPDWENNILNLQQINFRIRELGATDWQTLPVDSSRAGYHHVLLYQYDLGAYEYELSYVTGSGEILAGIGSINLNELPAVNSNNIIDFTDSLYVHSAITNQQGFNGSVWSGKNEIELNLSDLSRFGLGAISLEIEYNLRNSSGALDPSGPVIMTIGLSDLSARNGYTLEIPANDIDTDPNAYRTLDSIVNIRVFKKIDNTQVLLIQGNNIVQNEMLYLRGNTWGVSQIVVDNNNTLTLNSLGADVLAVDVSQLNKGDHIFSLVGSSAATDGRLRTHGSIGDNTIFLDEYRSAFNIDVSYSGDHGSGMNQLNLSWGSLADFGDGDVTLKFEYSYQFTNGNYWKFNNYNSTPTRNYMSAPKTSASIETTISASAAMTGYFWQWAYDSNTILGQAQRLQVIKKIDGQDVTIFDHRFGFTYQQWGEQNLAKPNASKLFVSNIPAEVDQLLLLYRPVGSESSYLALNGTKVSNSGGWFAFDYDQAPPGEYEYVLRARDANGNEVYLNTDITAQPVGDGAYRGVMTLHHDHANVQQATVLPRQATPITTFGYDAHGKATLQSKHAEGASLDTAQQFQLNSPNPQYDARVIRYYDHFGNLEREIDQEGGEINYQYDAAGNLKHESRQVSDFTGTHERYIDHSYNRIGQLTRTEHSIDATRSQIQYTEYNAFGEISARGHTQGALEEYFEYDNSGRLWRTNQDDGIDKVYLYDMNDQATALIKSADELINLRSYTDAAAVEAASRNNLQFQRSEITYNELGQVIAEKQLEYEQLGQSIEPVFVNDWIQFSDKRGDANSTELEFNWSSLSYLGDGDVYVTVEYRPPFAITTSTHSQRFSSTQADSGVTLQIAEEVNSLSKISVWKDINGNLMQVFRNVYMSDIGDIYNNYRIYWRSDQLAAEQASFELRKTGDQDWLTRPVTTHGGISYVNAVGLSIVDPGASSSGIYEYKVTYRHSESSDITQQKIGNIDIIAKDLYEHTHPYDHVSYSPILPVTVGTTPVLTHDVLSNQAGDKVLIYTKNENGISIYSRRFDAVTQSWGAEYLVENQPDDARFVNAAMDETGNVLITWQQHDNGSEKVFAAYNDIAGGTWTTYQVHTIPAGNATEFKSVFNELGNAMVVWQEDHGNGSYVVKAAYFDKLAQNWQTSTISADAHEVELVSTRQQFWLGWIYKASSTTQIKTNVFDNYSGTWRWGVNPWTLISTGAQIDNIEMAANDIGNVDIIFSDSSSGKIYHNHYNQTSAWEDTISEVITGMPMLSSIDIALNNNNEKLLVYKAPSSEGYVVARAYRNGQWATAKNIGVVLDEYADPAEQPKVYLDENGQAWVTYIQRDAYGDQVIHNAYYDVRNNILYKALAYASSASVYESEIPEYDFTVIDGVPEVSWITGWAADIFFYHPPEPAPVPADLLGTTLVETKTSANSTKLYLYGDIEDIVSVNLAGTEYYPIQNTQHTTHVFDLGQLTAGQYTAEIQLADLSTRTINFNVIDLAQKAVQQTSEWISPIRTQLVNRWGNIYRSTDVKGYQTDYWYNDQNKAYREVKPQIQVVSERGISSDITPTTQIHYDQLGRQIAITDANGHTNGVRYDALGRVLAQYQADGTILSSRYDLLGNKISDTDALGNRSEYVYDRAGRIVEVYRPHNGQQTLTSVYTYNATGDRIGESNGTGHATHYAYDDHGRVIAKRLPGGQTTREAYDFKGNKLSQSWDGLGDNNTWTYSYFGRLTGHNDLGGFNYTYSYDVLGRKVAQTSGHGQDQSFTYYHNNQMRSFIDNTLNSRSDYTYDIANNLVGEQYSIAGQQYTDARMQYDALNRLIGIDDLRYDLSYSYDAINNRRHTRSHYIDKDGSLNSLDYWYRYDAMNRITVSKGVLYGGRIIINQDQGVELTYDTRGNRASTHYYRDLNGAKQETWENYEYDERNRLHVTLQDGRMLSRREYDNADRVISYYQYNYDDEHSSDSQKGIKISFTGTSYNTNGWVSSTSRNSSVSQSDYGGWSWTHESTTTYDPNSSYDVFGNVLSYSSLFPTGTNRTYNTTISYAAKFDTYKQTTETTSQGGSVGSTTRSYDVNGNLYQVFDKENSSEKYTNFVLNNNGQIIQKTQGSKQQHYYYVGGKSVGTVGQMTETDFDFNYTPISSQFPAATPSVYIINTDGETLQAVAQAVYGDSSLWYLIADANNLSGTESLAVGRTLTIPNKITNLHNTDQTQKPYNPAKIIGAISPTLPAPKEPSACQQVILAVVTVVVAWYVGTQIPNLAGKILGAVLGSLASQTVGVALGLRDGIDWKSVGIAAISAGVGNGIDLDIGGGVVGAIVEGAVKDAVTQGVSVALGLQDKFDWKAVAVSGLTAGAISLFDQVSQIRDDKKSPPKGRKAKTEIDWGLKKPDSSSSLKPDYSRGINTSVFISKFTSSIFKNIQKGIIKQAIKHAAYDGKFDWINVVADAFGNTLVQSLEAATNKNSPERVAIREREAEQRRNILARASKKSTPRLRHSSPLAKIVADAEAQQAREAAIRNLQRTAKKTIPEKPGSWLLGDRRVNDDEFAFIDPEKLYKLPGFDEAKVRPKQKYFIMTEKGPAEISQDEAKRSSNYMVENADGRLVTVFNPLKSPNENTKNIMTWDKNTELLFSRFDRANEFEEKGIVYKTDINGNPVKLSTAEMSYYKAYKKLSSIQKMIDAVPDLKEKWKGEIKKFTKEDKLEQNAFKSIYKELGVSFTLDYFGNVMSKPTRSLISVDKLQDEIKDVFREYYDREVKRLGVHGDAPRREFTIDFMRNVANLSRDAGVSAILSVDVYDRLLKNIKINTPTWLTLFSPGEDELPGNELSVKLIGSHPPDGKSAFSDRHDFFRNNPLMYPVDVAAGLGVLKKIRYSANEMRMYIYHNEASLTFNPNLGEEYVNTLKSYSQIVNNFASGEGNDFLIIKGNSDEKLYLSSLRYAKGINFARRAVFKLRGKDIIDSSVKSIKTVTNIGYKVGVIAGVDDLIKAYRGVQSNKRINPFDQVAGSFSVDVKVDKVKMELTYYVYNESSLKSFGGLDKRFSGIEHVSHNRNVARVGATIRQIYVYTEPFTLKQVKDVYKPK